MRSHRELKITFQLQATATPSTSTRLYMVGMEIETQIKSGTAFVLLVGIMPLIYPCVVILFFKGTVYAFLGN